MHILELLLLLPIPSNSRTHRTKVTLSPVLDALTPVLQLALGLLLLASRVLLGARLAQGLVADRVADGFLGRADGLVPGAVAAGGVVLCDGAGVGVGGEVAQFGGGVGVGVLDVGLLLGEFAFGLGGC
jgi:hypothetical protein